MSLSLEYLEREKMLKDRPQVEAAVEQLARRHGYLVQRSADAFAGRKIYLTFTFISVLEKKERIEIDLNFLFRVPFSGTSIRELWQPGELDRPRVQVIGLDELAAGKMLALLNREIAQRLIPLFSVDEAPRARDMVKKAWRVMKPFLSLKPGERDYLIHRGHLTHIKAFAVVK